MSLLLGGFQPLSQRICRTGVGPPNISLRATSTYPDQNRENKQLREIIRQLSEQNTHLRSQLHRYRVPLPRLADYRDTRMPKQKTGYYGVKKGRIPGVYNTWAECEAQVKGL